MLNLKKNLVLTFRVKSFHPYYLNNYLVKTKIELSKNKSISFLQSFLPKKYEKFTLLKSPHVDKKARNQYERVTYNRLFQLSFPKVDTYVQKDFNWLLNFLQNSAIGVDVTFCYFNNNK